MDKLLKDEYLAASVTMQKTMVKRLNANGFFYVDDFGEVNTWELFKIRGLGINKFAIIQHIMKKNGIQFKDGYLKLPKSVDKYLFKQGLI